MIRVGIPLLIAILIVSALPQQPPPAPDPFAALRFLAGDWRGEQKGEPGAGVSERTYRFVLGGRFLQVQNTSTYPPQEKNRTGEKHHDVGMISYDKARKKLVLRQFHSEGFVNTYVETDSGQPKKLVFESEAIENIPAGWRARETYLLLNENEFIERFELAAPGKDFELYSEAHLKRVAALSGEVSGSR